MNNIKAIETQYKGYRFRSRLEARWAVFFDALGVKWEYEKEGYEFGGGERYLPDFWLPDHELWIEVKGQEINEEDTLKLIYLQDATKHSAFVFMQIPDSPDSESWYEDFTPFLHERCWSTALPIPGLQPLAHMTDYGEHKYEYHLLCPVCKTEYVHFNAPDHVGSDDYKAWDGRGAAIYIPMWCESGHLWRMRLGFHKGCTYMAMQDAWQEIHNPGLVFAGCNLARLAKAFDAARSARFEHGEKPKVYA